MRISDWSSDVCSSDLALNVRIITDPRGARALIKGTAAEAPQLRHTEICIVFELMQFLKSVTEGRFVPQRITLHCSQRAPQAEYDKSFGCPISFGADESEQGRSEAHTLNSQP